MSHSSPYGPVGSGLKGTLPNPLVVPEEASLVIGQRVFGIRFTQATISSSGGGGSTATFTYASTAPASPMAGDRWLDSDTGILYTYVNDGDSNQWAEF